MSYTDKQIANVRGLSPDAERRLVFSSSKYGQDKLRAKEFLDRVGLHAEGRRKAIGQAVMIVKRLVDLKVIRPGAAIELQGAVLQDVMGENVVYETNAAHRIPAQILVDGLFLFQLHGPDGRPLSNDFVTRTMDLFAKTDVVPKVVNSIDSVLDWTPMALSKKPVAKIGGKIRVTLADDKDCGLDRFLALLYKAVDAKGNSLDDEFRKYINREAELLNMLCMIRGGEDHPEESAIIRAMTGPREQDLRSDLTKAGFQKMDERMLRNEMNAQKLAILEVYTEIYQRQERALSASEYWQQIVGEKWI